MSCRWPTIYFGTPKLGSTGTTQRKLMESCHSCLRADLVLLRQPLLTEARAQRNASAGAFRKRLIWDSRQVRGNRESVGGRINRCRESTGSISPSSLYVFIKPGRRRRGGGGQWWKRKKRIRFHLFWVLKTLGFSFLFQRLLCMSPPHQYELNALIGKPLKASLFLRLSPLPMQLHSLMDPFFS